MIKVMVFWSCSTGARIIMACRDLEKAERAHKEIMEDSGNQNIVIKKLNLSDTKSIREFAEVIINGKSFTVTLKSD